MIIAEHRRPVTRAIKLDAAAHVGKGNGKTLLEHYAGKDFEDALQIAAANRAGATTFLKLDARLAKKYQKFQ